MISIEVDPRPVIEGLRRLVQDMELDLKVIAKQTAEDIATEARSRVARRTGRTASGIVVEETHDGKGYVVAVRSDPEELGRLLEQGTKHMAPRTFLEPAKKLEEGSFARRTADAVQDAIDGIGFKP